MAHQIEAMARQKKLKPLAKYLNPPKQKSQGGDNVAIIEMFEQLAEKNPHVKVRRVERKSRNPPAPD